MWIWSTTLMSVLLILKSTPTIAFMKEKLIVHYAQTQHYVIDKKLVETAFILQLLPYTVTSEEVDDDRQSHASGYASERINMKYPVYPKFTRIPGKYLCTLQVTLDRNGKQVKTIVDAEFISPVTIELGPDSPD
jgi:hypothetical protein